MKLPLINPYIYSRSVHSSEFVGRKSEMSNLVSRLATEQSTAVIGPPHVGKTSLLNQMNDYLTNSTQRRTLFLGKFDKSLFRMLDAHMLRQVKSQTEFWEYALIVFSDLLDTGEAEHLRPLQPFYLWAKENGFGSTVLEKMFTCFKSQNVFLILFIDEFDDLLSHPVLNSAEFYGSLRSLASRQLGLILVLGSRHTIEQLNILTQSVNAYSSPYFNVFTQITLKNLAQSAVDELMDRSCGRFDQNDRDFIRAVSGNYPMLVQAAAAKIWEAEDEELTGYPRFEYAGNNLYCETKLHFSDCWRIFPNEVRRAVTIVALAQFPHLVGKHTFAIKNNLKALYDYAPELHILEDECLVARSGDIWAVTQGAFLWWLADELIRNVRSDVDFKTWLQAQEMDGLLTNQQQEHLSKAISKILEQLTNGATTLIESFARGAASAALKQMGMG